MSKFHSFVILAGMRTGSNLLEANLNALEGLTSYGEVFNPHFVGRKNADELFGITLADRDRDPRPLLEMLRSATPGLSGFRLFHDHDPRVLKLVLADPGCAKIILTRNPVDSFVSLQIARATGQWRLADAKRLKSATAQFDEAEFIRHLEAHQSFQMQVLRALQVSGQTGFILDYADLDTLAVINGLAAFLGVPGRLKVLDDSLKKQNPEGLDEKLENPQALAQALARVDMFGLARTPIFEPRRAANLRDCVAVNGERLLFFPTSGAPDGEIRAWLAGLGELEQGFNPRLLSQWKQENPGHRSFTVIRHPLLRAYQAFHGRIVSGLLANHRTILIRAYKAKLPEPGQPFANPAAERAAFLIFLHYARLSVLGQCGQKVDPYWASQTALVQAIADVHPLDHILREDQMHRSVAGVLGVSMPDLPQPASLQNEIGGLTAILDDRVQAAAAAAYARDYTGFGFGPWRGQAA